MPSVKRIKGLGWRPDTPDARDKKYLFKPTAIKLPVRSFLEGEFIPAVRDQGDEGSCTGHATAAAVSYTRCKWGQAAEITSPRFVYWNARVLESSTGEDSGAEIRDAIKGVHQWGVCQEQACPYRPGDYANKPDQAAFDQAQSDILKVYRRIDAKLRVRALKEAVVRRQPVVFGFSVYESFDSDGMMNTGEMPMPRPREALVGGHAVWIVGYDNSHGNKGAFLIQNSWAQDWGCEGPTGTRGYLWMPYDFIADPYYADDLWALKAVT